jgi:hypothetical protein
MPGINAPVKFSVIVRMGQRHQVQRTLGLKMAAKPADEVRCTYQKQNCCPVFPHAPFKKPDEGSRYDLVSLN